jgi:hypothetical protein
VAQGVGPEFKPQYCRKEKKKKKRKRKQGEGWEYSLMVKCLPIIYKALGSSPVPQNK